MSFPNQPAVLIIHGAYFLPEFWNPFMQTLSQAGFLARCPRLQTYGDGRPPTEALEDDVIAVRSVATGLFRAGHPIIVIAHSDGGIIASEAIREDLYAKQPSASNATNNAGGVVGMMYMAAWLLLPGSSVGNLIEKYGFQSKVNMDFNHDGTVSVKNAPDCFYNDIETQRAEELANKNVSSNWSTASDNVTHAPWKDIPTTYVYCSRDMAIFLPLQENMVKDAKEMGGAANLSTHKCNSGHCPFLSIPAEIVHLVSRIWETAQRQ